MRLAKICILGAFGVGKTSLVRRFVLSMFSDAYLSTVGVKIDKKVVAVAGSEMTLLLWDLYGEDAFQRLQLTYLRGAAGFVFVIDGTRRQTLDTALSLLGRAEQTIGSVPRIIIINKGDLEQQIDPVDLAHLHTRGEFVLRTSAKTGHGVEAAFTTLAERVMSS